jgi:hypothetical protein
MYKSEYLKAYEIVDRETYNRFGEASYRFFDPLLLKVADWLRVNLGAVTCNDWHWRQDENTHAVFEWSGLRTARWDEVQPSSSGNKKYSPYSDHALGNALDLKFRNHDAFYVRQYIKDNWERMKNETGVESITIEEGPTITWVHIATRNNKNGINIFNV